MVGVEVEDVVAEQVPPTIGSLSVAPAASSAIMAKTAEPTLLPKYSFSPQDTVDIVDNFEACGLGILEIPIDSPEPFSNEELRVGAGLNKEELSASDLSFVTYAETLQSQLIASGFKKASSINSPEAIDFYSTVLKAPPDVISILTEGYRPSFDIDPPQTYYEANNKSALLHPDFVRDAIDKLCLNKFATEVDSRPLYCNPLSVASRVCYMSHNLKLR